MSQRDSFPLASALAGIVEPHLASLRIGDAEELLELVTPVTGELLRYWFQEDYCDLRQINFHDGQARALLAIIYAHEVLHAPTLRDLYKAVAPEALLAGGLLGEVADARHNHPKYCAKMATGTGKTWVLNALLIWQYLNRVASPEDARFTRNFLLVAPGLIVYDRLLDSFKGKERDGERHFETSDIFTFRELFIPENYRDAIFNFIQSSVATKTEIGRKVTGGGVIAITNWHLLAGEEDSDFLPDVETPGADFDPKAIVESIFPISPGTSAGNSLDALDRAHLRGGPLQSLKDLPDLLVFNDEAHHIHEVKRGGETSEVEWQKSLMEIAENKGDRFIQVDFSATPYNQIGSGRNQQRKYFPHIVVDFDLNAAISSGLVKSLTLDKRKEVAALPLDFQSERDENGNVSLSDGQRTMIRAGLEKLRILEQEFEEIDPSKHPKMLIVCEDTKVSPKVVEFLLSTGLGEEDVLQVDSNRKGEMSKVEWDATRERLFDIDRHRQPKVIVSVLMLREGFDVNNICVIVPLRATRAQILLEQTVGRGLRLMWRGDEGIDELKQETREHIKNRKEPTNYFDVLFIVEHPAFVDFYNDLIEAGLAGTVDDTGDSTSAKGDLETVHLRDGFEAYDFAIPHILREAEEELSDPSIDPMLLPPILNVDRAWLKQIIGKGDVFVSQDVQTLTQYGDYRVHSGVMTATGYNDYIGRITRRISEALSGGLTKSQAKYNEISKFPFIQVHLPLLAAWIDSYIRQRLFGESFDPLEDENWRLLLVDDVVSHITSSFASALVEAESNRIVGQADVRYTPLSSVESITVRTSSCVEVAKAIYPKLPVPKRSGGLERKLMLWADQDSHILAFCKIHEYKHAFVQRRYLKADGMPASYSPDFLIRTGEQIYVVETKAQRDLSNENVNRKRIAAVAWCDQINELPPEQRDGREWHYVILGEDAVTQWQANNARLAELLEYARLRGSSLFPEQPKLL